MADDFNVWLCFCLDVGSHLLFKNGASPTLWPQNVPYPSEDQGDKESDFNADAPSPDTTHYPSYFKDAKGVTHPAFGVTKLPGMPLFVKCPICQKVKDVKM